MNSARRSAPDAPRPPGSIRRLMRWIGSPTGVALLAVALVGGIAAAISYSHMLDWAKANDDPASEWRAYPFPLSVDGAIVAASAVLYADSRAGRKGDWLGYMVIVIGVLWSIIANVAHNTTGWAAEKSIAGWPPVALALVVELVFRFIRRMAEQAEQRAAAEAEAVQLDEAARVEAERLATEATRAAEEAALRKAEVEERRRERQREKAEQQPGAEVVQLRAASTEGIERPWWLAKDATAEQAMRAYLGKVNSEASGAELDRAVGAPYFNTAPGYGRKVARAWRDEQDQQQRKEV